MKKSILQYINIVVIISIIVSIMFFNSSIYSAGSGFNPGVIDEGEGIPVLEGIFSNIWATIVFILQILSIASIIITGVRYMFSSADKKADLKGGLIPILIGSVLVFGASTIASFIVRAATQAGIR